MLIWGVSRVTDRVRLGNRSRDQALRSRSMILPVTFSVVPALLASSLPSISPAHEVHSSRTESNSEVLSLDEALEAVLRGPQAGAERCEMPSDPAIAPADLCSFGKEPPLATTALNPPLDTREQRRRELDAFCESPRAKSISAQQAAVRSLSDQTVEAALREVSQEEVDAVLEIAADPYLEDALSTIVGMGGPSAEQTDCRLWSKVAAESVAPSSTEQSGVMASSQRAQTAATESCKDKDPGPFFEPTRPVRISGICSSAVVVLNPPLIICPTYESREACEARRIQAEAQARAAAESSRIRAQAECAAREAQAEAEAERKHQETVAAARAAHQSKRDAHVQCRTEVIEAEIRKIEEARSAEASRAKTKMAEAERKSFETCMARTQKSRILSLCAPLEDLGVIAEENSWHQVAGRSQTCTSVEAERKASESSIYNRLEPAKGLRATPYRDNLDLLISSYADLLPPPQRQSCEQRIPNGQSICAKLEKASRTRGEANQRIYTPDRMKAASVNFDSIMKDLERWIDSSSLTAEQKTALRERITGVELTAPNGSAGLAHLYRGAGGYFICGATRKGTDGKSDVCQSKQVQLSPDFLLALASDDPSQQASVLPVILHELGHALAPPGTASAAPFDRLTRCLDAHAGTRRFLPANQPVVQSEAVADWLASQVIGMRMSDDRYSSVQERLKGAEDHLAPLVCNVLRDPLSNVCGAPHPTVDAYPLEMNPQLNEFCAHQIQEKDHPYGADRLQNFLVQGGLQNAIGCPPPKTQSERQARTCSL